MHLYHKYGMPVRYKYTELALRESASKSKSTREFMVNLGIESPRSGSMLAHLKSRCQHLGIDLSHLKKITSGPRASRLLPDQVLVKGTANGRRQTGVILTRSLVQSGVAHQCGECSIGPEWNGKPLTLQVDHCNGDVTDNRIDNLRFLCPNCHTQTSNWGTRNKPPAPTVLETSELVQYWASKLPPIEELAKMVWEVPPKNLANRFGVSHMTLVRHLEGSGVPLPNRRYWEVKNKGLVEIGVSPPDISWPILDELRELVWAVPMVHLAERYGGTGNALKKYCKKHGIAFPGRGYWQAIAGEATRKDTYPSNSELESLLSEESLTKVAARCGVTFASLSKHCKKAGVKVPCWERNAVVVKR